jgi:hypothetical protein
MKTATTFRFNAADHEYLDLDTGECFPHITGMLSDTGWVDDEWFTEESSERGIAVHRLTADYDLKALDVPTCTSKFRGYLLAYVKLVGIAQPTWLAVEEPLVHSTLRFGGRPDRDCIAYKLRAAWEIKSGAPARSHQIQTALQAMLIGDEAGLPYDAIRNGAVSRFCCYVKATGKFKLDEHKDRRDFDEARRIIRECTR